MGLLGSCQDVAKSLADEAGETGLPLGIRLHLLMCRHCRRYREQLRTIADAARRAWPGGEDPTADELRNRILGNKP